MIVSSKPDLNLKSKNLKNRLFFLNFPLNIRIFLLVFCITLLVFFIFFFKSPNYSILYSNLSSDDEKFIVMRLIHLNIPFKFNENHSVLLVPKNKLQEVHIDLLEQGLPKEKNVGYELLDSEKFGLSQFNEQINYQRALEGELARSIQQLDSIKTARVHIVFPKSSLFIHEKKLPSASIILGIKPGYNLDYNQVNAILHMVSGSVSDLLVDNITIIDQTGKLLNNINDIFNNNVENVQLKYSSAIENNYKQRIEEILFPLVGFNNVYAQVTAQIDFDKKERSEEKFSPNYNNDQKSIRSHQNKSDTKFIGQHLDKFAPINDNDLISNGNNYSSKLSTSKLVLSNDKDKNRVNNLLHIPKSSSHQDYVINYELDHTISHYKFHIGNIKRISVAVIINYIKDKNGMLIPLHSKELKDIKKLVCEVIGFSYKRGDSVSVLNAPFFKPKLDFKKKLDYWNINFILDQLFKFSFVIIGVIFLYIIYKKLSFANFVKNSNNQLKEDNILKKHLLSTDNNIREKKEDLQRKIDEVSKTDSKTIAMIIRQWINDKKL